MDASFQVAEEFNRRTHGVLLPRVDTAIVGTIGIRVPYHTRNRSMDAKLMIQVER
jgi:hypothetical protein